MLVLSADLNVRCVCDLLNFKPCARDLWEIRWYNLDAKQNAACQSCQRRTNGI